MSCGVGKTVTADRGDGSFTMGKFFDNGWQIEGTGKNVVAVQPHNGVVVRVARDGKYLYVECADGACVPVAVVVELLARWNGVSSSDPNLFEVMR